MVSLDVDVACSVPSRLGSAVPSADVKAAEIVP